VIAVIDGDGVIAVIVRWCDVVVMVILVMVSDGDCDDGVIEVMVMVIGVMV
jgi:hypothetical protein